LQEILKRLLQSERIREVKYRRFFRMWYCLLRLRNDYVLFVAFLQPPLHRVIMIAIYNDYPIPCS